MTSQGSYWLVYLRSPIRSTFDKPQWNLEHLGLATIAAAMVRSGRPAEILNAAQLDLDVKDVLEILVKAHPKFVGFSPTCMTMSDSLWLAKELKGRLPDTHICLGGQQATMAAARIITDCLAIDSIVCGYGEKTISPLLDTLENGGVLADVKGICWRDPSGRAVHNPMQLVTLASRANALWPRRDKESIDQGIFTIETSRGCPNHCAFCVTPMFRSSQGLSGWDARQADNVVDEIEYLCRRSPQVDRVSISMIDDNFIINTPASKQRAADIAHGVIERRLRTSFWFMAAPCTFSAKDSTLLSLLREAGFACILLGIESRDMERLRAYGKPWEPSHADQTIRLLSEYGFVLHCSMILFHPYATFTEILRNARYIADLLKRPAMTTYTTYASRLLIFPGVPLATQLAKDGLLSAIESYTDPQAYRFIDSRVELLHRYLVLLEGDLAAVDWSIYDTRSVVYPAVCADKSSPRLRAVWHTTEQVIRDVTGRSYQGFCRAAGAAERLDEPALETAVEKYRRELQQCSQLLAGLGDVRAMVKEGVRQ